MRCLWFRASALLVFLAGSWCLEATPFSLWDAAAACPNGISHPACAVAGNLLGPKGAPLPESLADLSIIATLTGEGTDASLDRSMELNGSAIDSTAFESSNAAIVAGPQMMSSIQVSFDPRFDLGDRQRGAAQRLLASHRLADMRNPPSVIDAARAELTLGAVLRGIEDSAAKTISDRSLDRTTYVSFALVNQAHLSVVSASEPEAEEEDDGSLFAQ